MVITLHKAIERECFVLFAMPVCSTKLSRDMMDLIPAQNTQDLYVALWMAREPARKQAASR
jgi:hypothetical protein